MRRSKSAKFIVGGACVALLLAIAFSAAAVRPGKYVGSEDCSMCHGDTHAALLQSYDKSPHHLAMVDAAKSPAAIVAKFDADSPIKKADIKYVLGKGRSYQNYLDKDLKVLPAKWLVKEKKWAPQKAADGATQCVGCHTTNFDPGTKKWTELGVGCEMCHGPAGEHVDSMDPEDITDLRKLDAQKLNMVCGQCHSQGTDLTGKYAFSTTFVPGQDLGKHFKLKPVQAGAPNQEYNEFITSKHAEGGMKCTTCHDTHGNKAKAPHQLTKPVNDLCLGCHAPMIGTMKEHAPSAAADATCASCHMPDSSHEFKQSTAK